MDFSIIFDKMDKWANEFDPEFTLGLSGGGDSFALLYICKEWLKTPNAKKINAKVHPIIIDHNIAKNSATVAQFAFDGAVNLGFEPQILRIEHKITSAIQEKAREYRYELLHQAAKDLSINKILLAHNYGDLAETIIFRMLRGTDIFGLNAMREISFTNQAIILRPILHLTRENLREICKVNDVGFYDDPANENEKFSRVKIRNAIKTLCLDSDKIQNIAQKAAIIRGHFEQSTFDFLSQNAIFDENRIAINKNKVLMLGNDKIAFLFNVTLRLFSHYKYPIRSGKLNKLIEKIKTNGFKSTTLGHVIIKSKQDNFIFARAPIRKNMPAPEFQIFDEKNWTQKIATICNIKYR